MVSDNDRWLMAGFFGGIHERPLNEVLDPLLVALDQHIKDLEGLAEKIERESKHRQEIYATLEKVLSDERNQWHSLLNQAEQSTEALETVSARGGLMWLILAVAAIAAPVLAVAVRTAPVDDTTLWMPVAVVLATMLAAWRGTSMYVPSRQIEALVRSGATPAVLSVVTAVGCLLALLVESRSWQMVGVILSGSVSGVAVACRWANREAQAPIVSDLSRRLDLARTDSASREAERQHSRTRLRTSAHETREEISSLAANRERLRERVTLGHQLGSSFRPRKK